MDWIEKGWGKPRLKVTGDLKYRSTASNFEGLESKPLAVESFVTKPSVPRNVSVTEVSVGKILVQWEESSSGTPFEYKVYAQSTGQTFLKKSTIKVSNRFRATINSLTPGVTYKIYVFAINEAGSSELAPPSSITLSTNSGSSSQTGYVPPSAAQIAEDQAAARAKAASTVSASTLVYTPVYSPASQAPASQAPASQAPASQAPASQAPASQAPASQAPASQAPASQAPASQAPASQAPASQAPASQAPASQAPASQAPASQAPASQAPASQAPASQAPASQAPASQAPASQAPASQAPASQAPASQAPASQSPASQAPASQAPASQAPASQAPASQAPASQAPASQAPASQAPASQAPASQAPASQAPSTVSSSSTVQVSGCTPYSGTPKVPDAPTNIRAIANPTNTGFTITWDPPNSYGLPILYYELYRHDGNNFTLISTTSDNNGSHYTCENKAPITMDTNSYPTYTQFVPSGAVYYIFGITATNSIGTSTVGHKDPKIPTNWVYYNSAPSSLSISISSTINTTTVTWSYPTYFTTGILNTSLNPNGDGNKLGSDDNLSKDPKTVITGFVVKCYNITSTSSILIDTKTITDESTKTTTFTNLSGSYTYTVQARNSVGLSPVASTGNYVGAQGATITNIDIQTIYGCIPRLSFTIAAPAIYTRMFCDIYYRALSDTNVSTTQITPPFVQDSSGNYYKSDYNNDRGGYSLPVTAGSNVHILPVNTSLYRNTRYLVNIDLRGFHDSTQVPLAKASSFYTSVPCDTVDKPVILSNSQVFSANWSNVTTTLYVSNSPNNIKNNLDFFMRQSGSDNEDIRSYNNINPGNFFPRSNSYILQLRPGSSNTLSLGARGSTQVESDPYTIIAMKYPPPTNLQYVNSNFGDTNIYLSWTSPQPLLPLSFIVTDVTNSYSYSPTSNTYLYMSLDLGASYTFNVTVGNSVLGSNSSNLSFTTYMPDSASNCYVEIYSDRQYIFLYDYIRWDTTASNLAYGVKYNLRNIITNTEGVIITSSPTITIYTRYYPLPYNFANRYTNQVAIIPLMGGKEALNKSVTTTTKLYADNASRALMNSCCGGRAPYRDYPWSDKDTNAVENTFMSMGGMNYYHNIYYKFNSS